MCPHKVKRGLPRPDMLAQNPAYVGVGGLGVGDSEEEGLDWEEVGWRSSWEEAG